MKEEMDILKENKRFELTQLPPNKTVVTARWVYIYILKQTKIIKKNYKDRLVVKGCNPSLYIDYQEKFSPTPKMTWINANCNAAQLNSTSNSMLRRCYLNAHFHREFYMDKAKGFLDRK